MARVVGAVGEARADPVAALDEIHPLARMAAPEQMNGGHDPTEAGADHGDAAAFPGHRLASLFASSAGAVGRVGEHPRRPGADQHLEARRKPSSR